MLAADVSVGPSFDLAIKGTDVQFSELGLPSAMGGDVYLSKGGANSNASIGRYQESLTPIFMDMNGDQVPETFVGTQGVATFTFFVGAPQFLVGSITTQNVSYIQGFTPTGQLVVGSQGAIVASSGAMRDLAGGFMSQSTVALGPSFDLQTSVHFVVNRDVAPILNFVAFANDVYNHVKTSRSPKGSEDTNPVTSDLQDLQERNGRGKRDRLTSDDDGRDGRGHRSDSKHETRNLRHQARDRSFSENTDWKLDHLTKDLSLDKLARGRS